METTLKNSVEDGYRPDPFQLSKAIEHYRKSKRLPIPELMSTKFEIYVAEGPEIQTDEGTDGTDEHVTIITLVDAQEYELAKYKFVNRYTGNLRMQIIL